MITEIYVPRRDLAAFMAEVATISGRTDAVIYGTVRLIERDDETFLAWAREPWACIIFNLHVDHTPEGIERAGTHSAADRPRARHGGSYYLTYHRWATREQVEAAIHSSSSSCGETPPRPRRAFSERWYRHYREMFGENLFGPEDTHV